jgi:hypothetical protein
MNCKSCGSKLSHTTECEAMMYCVKCEEFSGECKEKQIQTQPIICEKCGTEVNLSSNGKATVCKQCGNVEQKEKVEQSPFSSAIQTVSNLAGTMKDFATSGFKTSDDEKYQKRLEVCMGCDSFDKKALRCTECSCFMKAKAKIDSAKCPLDKWED